jgi:putative two-component system response regulator
MGMDEKFRQNILFAAPLHDIGKIAISDNVLRKPGKLDDDEWEIMRRHSQFGAKILGECEAEFVSMAEVIASTHHEKWDGTGYPIGLKGEQIPIAGRIVAVTDTFDALTWERPYKQPVSIEKAFIIIENGRGTQFAPDVVDAFLNIRDEIIAEYNWWKFLGTETLPF